ncbi:MAG: TIGR02679 family protein [Dermatophilaceae bacterium]
MTSELPDWWSADVLSRVWAQLAERLERNGLQARGTIVVNELDRGERHALGGLLGRVLASDTCRVDLSLLDERLRGRSDEGLARAAERVLDRSLVDRPAQRQARGELREAPFAAARSWLEQHPALDQRWVQTWLATLRRDGVLMRDSDPSGLLLRALSVLAACLDDPVRPSKARTELAAGTAHDAHALDDDRGLTQLVLRALALRVDRPAPTSASERRDVWESVGVTTYWVSSNCLTRGLGVLDGWSGALRCQLAADSGDPIHITWWDLRRGLEMTPGQEVFVCENPRVLEAIAERELGGIAIVCTSGRSTLVVLEVLRRLAESGAHIRYHGDFDWPGVAMANQLVAMFDVQPWRMSADDYLDSPARLRLVGSEVAPAWDAELGAAMRHRGLAVHEEAVLGGLLDSLWPRT